MSVTVGSTASSPVSYCRCYCRFTLGVILSASVPFHNTVGARFVQNELALQNTEPIQKPILHPADDVSKLTNEPNRACDG